MLVTSTINLKAILNQTLYLPPYISSNLNSDSELNSNSNYLNLYLNPDTQPNIKPDTEPDINNKLDISIHPNLKLGLKDLGLDSKAKKILKDIAELKNKELAKLNHISYIKKL